jgi:chromosome segregation ATPase
VFKDDLVEQITVHGRKHAELRSQLDKHAVELDCLDDSKKRLNELTLQFDQLFNQPELSTQTLAKKYGAQLQRSLFMFNYCTIRLSKQFDQYDAELQTVIDEHVEQMQNQRDELHAQIDALQAQAVEYNKDTQRRELELINCKSQLWELSHRSCL